MHLKKKKKRRKSVRNMSPSYIQLEELMIIILQFFAVKLSKINSRHFQMLMPCPSHSTSHEFELLGGHDCPQILGPT